MKKYSKAVLDTVKFIVWNNRVEKTEDYQNVFTNHDKQFSKDIIELLHLIRENGESWFEEKYNVRIDD